MSLPTSSHNSFQNIYTNPGPPLLVSGETASQYDLSFANVVTTGPQATSYSRQYYPSSLAARARTSSVLQNWTLSAFNVAPSGANGEAPPQNYTECVQLAVSFNPGTSSTRTIKLNVFEFGSHIPGSLMFTKAYEVQPLVLTEAASPAVVREILWQAICSGLYQDLLTIYSDMCDIVGAGLLTGEAPGMHRDIETIRGYCLESLACCFYESIPGRTCQQGFRPFVWAIFNAALNRWEMRKDVANMFG